MVSMKGRVSLSLPCLGIVLAYALTMFLLLCCLLANIFLNCQTKIHQQLPNALRLPRKPGRGGKGDMIWEDGVALDFQIRPGRSKTWTMRGTRLTSHKRHGFNRRPGVFEFPMFGDVFFSLNMPLAYRVLTPI